MSFLLDLQTPPDGLDSGTRGFPVNPLSTISVGQICLLSTISLSLC